MINTARLLISDTFRADIFRPIETAVMHLFQSLTTVFIDSK